MASIRKLILQNLCYGVMTVGCSSNEHFNSDLIAPASFRTRLVPSSGDVDLKHVFAHIVNLDTMRCNWSSENDTEEVLLDRPFLEVRNV